LHNSVASFAIDAEGQLRAIGDTWVHADSPRSLVIDPTGQYLYSCNQKGDSITSFRLSAATGAPQFTGRFEAVGSPAAMVILKFK
jgi:6-phosphogluconolactonase (cycloisomerase 2 family)